MKKLKKLRMTASRFAYSLVKQYLCTVKRIAYIMPIDYIRGNLSGCQVIEYDGKSAFEVAQGERVTAANYQPRFIAQVRGINSRNKQRIFMVRTRTTVNATENYKRNLAIMGGCGAIYGAIVIDKSSALYGQCVSAFNSGKILGDTLRSYLFRHLRAGLAAKNAQITLDGGVVIDNPWVYTGTPNVVLDANIINKFNAYLS